MGTKQPRGQSDYAKNVQLVGPLKTRIIEQIKDVAKTKGMIRRIEITPEMAEDIMSLNANNRPVKESTVIEYATAMQEGRWMYTSESILAIDTNLHLQQGQQRLLAIIMCGLKQTFDIGTGYDPDAFKVLDSGRNRTAGDAFALEGIDDHNRVAMAASFVIGLLIQGRVVSGMKSKGITTGMLTEWAREEKNRKRIVECCETATMLYSHGRWLSHTLYAGMLYCLGVARRADAEEFMTRLATGEDISTTKDSAIYYLRNILLKWKEKNHGKGFGYKRTNELKVSWIITAWNLYIQKDAKGRSITITGLKLDKDEVGIPKIKRT